MAIDEPNLSNFPDCSALLNIGGCGWLDVPKCLGDKCPFSKSVEENTRSLNRTYRRLSSLNPAMQKRISLKYYGGRMPWNDTFDDLQAKT